MEKIPYRHFGGIHTALKDAEFQATLDRIEQQAHPQHVALIRRIWHCLLQTQLPKG